MMLVTLEQGKKLKDLMFDQPCTDYWHRDWHRRDDGTEIWHESLGGSLMNHNEAGALTCVSRPTVIQALEWMRNVKDIWAYPIRYEERGKWLYDYNFYEDGNRPQCSDDIFESWEAAESAALDWSIDRAANTRWPGCEDGVHDVIPVLGWENAVIGETCRQCGIKIS